jgi:predicted metalloendopeptidase
MDQQFSQMCEDIRESYRDLIANSDWLSQDARQLLLQKLDNIQFITGGFCLEQMKDDPSINSIFGDNTYETLRNNAKKKVQIAIDNIGKPRDRMELGMSMYTVNACYSLDNTVTITVAIMSPPFFDTAADYFTNLGGLGTVVAHEVGHAFDSNMIKYDATGVYDPTWLSAEDMAALEERNRVAVEYFEKHFSVFDVYRVDGELTLGENYADLGAMECVTNIAQTEEEYQKLFENYAKIWCELCLNTDVIEQLAEDPHSPATIRVNAILATTDAFYEVYGLKEGDGMYISPEERISRWK